MEIKLKYLAIIEKNKVKVSKLSEDARDGIAEIESVIRVIEMNEKKGKKVTPSTLKKIARLDKWVTNEILDFVDGTDNNTDKDDDLADEIIEEIEGEDGKNGGKEKDEQSNEDVVDTEIDVILEEFLKSGKTEITLDELGVSSKKIFKLIFDNYNDEEENGLRTSNFKVLEKEKKSKVFIISKI